MKKQIIDFKVIENRRVNPSHFILTLHSESALPIMLPGQFVEVKVDGSPTTFLRRPISIHDVDYHSNTLILLIQEKGDGTRKLASLQPGENLNIVLPLGNSFTQRSKGDSVLLVGGGCGVAPLLFLAKELHTKGVKVTILMGARSQDMIMEAESYQKYGELLITTEDGSVGKKGFVIHHPIWWEDKPKFDMIYTCGPDPMMKAISKLAAKYQIECEVSLEQTMACGVGACLCCVVDTEKGHVCTCTDGPIFNYKELKNWID